MCSNVTKEQNTIRTMPMHTEGLDRETYRDIIIITNI